MANEGLDQAEERFSANLRVARERAGMSQAALAAQMRALGYDSFRQNTIYRIETGKRSVGLGEAYALARVTQASLVNLVQPPGLAQEAWLILEALRRFRDAAEQITSQQLRRSNARTELERLVGQARKAGHADELATEIAAAERALAGKRSEAEKRADEEALYVQVHGERGARRGGLPGEAAG